MSFEPAARQAYDLLQRARLLKKVRRAGYNAELLFSRQQFKRAAVKRQYLSVRAAHDEERRCVGPAQPIASKVRAAAARYDSADRPRRICSRDEGGAGACAGAEVPDRRVAQVLALAKPVGGRTQAVREQADIEHVGAILRLCIGEQIEQQRAEAGFLQSAGYELVPRTLPPTAAAVRKQHHPMVRLRCSQIAAQPVGPDRDLSSNR